MSPPNTITEKQHQEDLFMRHDAEYANSLLLDLPVPFWELDGILQIEAQAYDGLQRWLDNFDQITVCAPLAPVDRVDCTVTWRAANDLLSDGRLRLEPMPWGYHPREHLLQAGRVRRRLRPLIQNHRYLCFSNLGWLGSWGNIAAEEARRIGKPYAVWLDWVLHEMPDQPRRDWPRRAFARFNTAMLKAHSLRAVREAALGLFHGRSVYEAYAPLSRAPHVVHNVHFKRTDIMTQAQLNARLARDAGPIRLGYVGRVHPMKGPIAWIETIDQIIRSAGSRDPSSRPITAVWLGDGPLIETARAAVRERGLEDQISFPGAEPDRGRVIEFFRNLDLFVFCHLTPESPRCLIEALMSGLPLLGFDSPYARDLVTPHGGGAYVDVYDTKGLATLIESHLQDPVLRRSLSMAALRSGQEYSEEDVFRHRSDLIRTHLAAEAALTE